MQRDDDRAFAAAQSFIHSARAFWTTRLYPAVRAEYLEEARSAPSRPGTPEEVARVMAPSATYQYYAWLERHLQRFKYSGRYGLHVWHARDRARLAAEMDAAAPRVPLELDPDLPMPRYYSAVDIHQHPGGVWSDPVAGLVYERGARSTTPLSGAKHGDLHDRFVAIALAEAPRPPARVLEMGCGFGKTTRPLAEACSQSEIDAIELAAPCLKVAARDLGRVGAKNVRLRQMDARHTDYPAARFDLVASTMLLHELPPDAIEATFAECARVLAPGGRMVHLDFLPHIQPQTGVAGEAFARFIHYGHGRRNNEPFMEPLAKLDVAAMLVAKGFRNVRIEPFEETDGALDPGYASFRYPWTLISAERA